MTPTDKCPDCNGPLIRIEDGVFTWYICDALYCDNCDKTFSLDKEYQPKK